MDPTNAYAVLSTWLACKDPLPKHWRKETRRRDACLKTFNEMQKRGTGGDSNLLSDARRNMRLLASLSKTFSELAAALRDEADTAFEQFNVISNMNGLLSLPQELLSSIFIYVVNGHPDEKHRERWKAAGKLSLVCRYFRGVALATPRIWANMSQSCAKKLPLCLSRVKDVGLNVELKVAFGSGTRQHDTSFDIISRRILPQSKRWESLALKIVRNDNDYDRRWKYLVDPKICQAFRNLEAPLLRSLQITCNKRPKPENLQEFAHWKVPNLRHLKTVNYFPLPISHLVNLTHLDIALSLGKSNFANVFKEISRMKALEDFTLSITNLGSPNDGDSFEETSLPSIRRLTLKIPFSISSALFRRIPGYALASTLSFPEVNDMRIMFFDSSKISGGYAVRRRANDDLPVGHFLHDEVSCIFRRAEQFPSVERLHLEVYTPYDDIERFINTKSENFITLSIPLEFVPSARYLSFKCNSWVDIDDPNSATRCHLWRDESIPPRSPAETLPKLETIKIDVPDMMVISGWLRRVLQSQKLRGEWDEFCKLEVVQDDNGGTHLGDRRIRTDTYVGDSALDWSASHVQ